MIFHNLKNISLAGKIFGKLGYIWEFGPLHTLVFTHITSVVKPVHIFMVRSRVSKSRLKAELCFHYYVHFACVLIKQSLLKIFRLLPLSIHYYQPYLYIERERETDR